MPQLALRLAQGMVSSGKTVVAPEIQTQQFIRHALSTSEQSTQDTMTAYDKNTRRRLAEGERAKVEAETFWNYAAHNINKSGPNMAATTCAYMGRGFGNSTLVTLPNGNEFNTRLFFYSTLM
jgi:non-ribosomal peptide synthetase component E (peptide arylation enzyme)